MTTSMCMSLFETTTRPDLAPWAQTVQQCLLHCKLHRFKPCLHWKSCFLSPYLCACQFWRPPIVQIWLHGLKRCNNACYTANYIDSSHASIGKVVPYHHNHVHDIFRDHHSSRFGSMGSNVPIMQAILQTASIHAMLQWEKLLLITTLTGMSIFKSSPRPKLAPWAQTVQQCLLHCKLHRFKPCFNGQNCSL